MSFTSNTVYPTIPLQIYYLQIPFLALLLFKLPLVLHVNDGLTIIYNFNNKVHHFHLCNVST